MKAWFRQFTRSLSRDKDKDESESHPQINFVSEAGVVSVIGGRRGSCDENDETKTSTQTSSTSTSSTTATTSTSSSFSSSSSSAPTTASTSTSTSAGTTASTFTIALPPSTKPAPTSTSTSTTPRDISSSTTPRTAKSHSSSPHGLSIPKLPHSRRPSFLSHDDTDVGLTTLTIDSAPSTIHLQSTPSPRRHIVPAPLTGPFARKRSGWLWSKRTSGTIVSSSTPPLSSSSPMPPSKLIHPHFNTFPRSRPVSNTEDDHMMTDDIPSTRPTRPSYPALLIPSSHFPHLSPSEIASLRGRNRWRYVVATKVVPHLAFQPDVIVKSFLTHKFGNFDVASMIQQNFSLAEFRVRVQSRLHHLDTTQKIDATTDIMVDMFRSLQSYNHLVSIASALNTDLSRGSLQSTLKTIISLVHKCLHTERVLLYIVDKSGTHLTLALSNDDHVQPRRIPMDHSIVGFVARTGESMNVRDAYAEPRFSDEMDRQTGFRTRNLLCVPVVVTVKDGDRVCAAVIEAANKHNEANFSDEDMLLLKFIGLLAGQTLQNSALYEEAVTRRRQQEALCRMLETMTAEQSVDLIIQRLIAASYQLLDVDRISFFIVDKEKNVLICKVNKDPSLVGCKVPLKHGIVGHVAATNCLINIRDATTDSRYDHTLDRVTGYQTHSLLTMPIPDRMGNVCAVIQVINKFSRERDTIEAFTHEDEDLMKSLTHAAGEILGKAQLYEALVLEQRKSRALMSVLHAEEECSDVEVLIRKILQVAHDILHSQRILLFFVDGIRQDVYCVVSPDNNKHISMSLKSGQAGLVGWTAINGIACNVADAYNDPRFNPYFDTITASRTSSTLCVPVKNHSSTTIAVLQAVNKINSVGDVVPFTEEDEHLFHALSSQVGSTLRRRLTEVLLQRSRRDTSHQIDSLLEIYGRRASREMIAMDDGDSSFLGLESPSRRWRKKAMSEPPRPIRYISPKRANHIIATSIEVPHTPHAPPPSPANATIAPTTVPSNEGTSPLFSPSRLMSPTDIRARSPSPGYSTLLIPSSTSTPQNTPSNTILPGSPALMALAQAEPYVHPYPPSFHRPSLVTSSPNLLSSSHLTINTQTSPPSTARTERVGSTSRYSSPSLIPRPVPIVAGQPSVPRASSMTVSSSNTSRSVSRSVSRRQSTGPVITAPILRTRGFSICDPSPYHDDDDVEHEIILRDRTLPAVYKRGPQIYVEMLWPTNVKVNLPSLATLEFNCFDYTEDELLEFCVAMFQDLGLIDRFQIAMPVMQSFLMAVRCNYRANPYHAWHHGFSVLQFCYWMVKTTRIGEMMPPYQLLALLVACLCHDIDHPGNTNNFEIQTGSDLARTHNDQAVLENHHAYTTFELLRDNSRDIFGPFNSNVGVAQLKAIRKTVILAILATDMAQHFDLCKKLDGLEPEFSSLNMEKEDDRQFVVNLVIHSADISGQVYPLPIAKIWEARVCEEFMAQAELEAHLNLPVAPFMQNLHDDAVRFKNHISFIDFVMSPLWNGMSEMLPPLSQCVSTLQSNRTYYASLVAAAKEKTTEKATTTTTSTSPTTSPTTTSTSNDIKHHDDIAPLPIIHHPVSIHTLRQQHLDKHTSSEQSSGMATPSGLPHHIGSGNMTLASALAELATSPRHFSNSLSPVHHSLTSEKLRTRSLTIMTSPTNRLERYGGLHSNGSGSGSSSGSSGGSTAGRGHGVNTPRTVQMLQQQMAQPIIGGLARGVIDGPPPMICRPPSLQFNNASFLPTALQTDPLSPLNTDTALSSADSTTSASGSSTPSLTSPNGALTVSVSAANLVHNTSTAGLVVSPTDHWVHKVAHVASPTNATRAAMSAIQVSNSANPSISTSSTTNTSASSSTSNTNGDPYT